MLSWNRANEDNHTPTITRQTTDDIIIISDDNDVDNNDQHMPAPIDENGNSTLQQLASITDTEADARRLEMDYLRCLQRKERALRDIEAFERRIEEERAVIQNLNTRMEDHIIDYREVVNPEQLRIYEDAIRTPETACAYFEQVIRERNRRTLPNINNTQETSNFTRSL